VDRRRREALRAQRDDAADRQNEFGAGQPDIAAGGVAKRRPQRPKGNSRELILRRLRNEFPAIHKLVLSGQISPFAGAVAAGFRKMPGRQPKRPADPSDISSDQEMELWLGAGHRSSTFGSEDERREAWTQHRDRLMELWGKGGRRPLAWWLFEAGELDYPGYDLERSTLFTAGLLAEAERAELLEYWRREFERLMDPNFGDMAACEAHIEWCDMPRELLTQWASDFLRKKKPPGMATEGLESA
jgi:hypothetical protein